MLIVKSLKNLFYFVQKTEQPKSDFREDFMALVEVIEEYGGAGSLTYFPNMIRKELTSRKIADVSEATPKELKEAKRIGRDKFLATLMLNGAILLQIKHLLRVGWRNINICELP